MSIEQTEIIDFASIDEDSGDFLLTISDHLPWDREGDHLLLLQKKLNAYLSFIESGEILAKLPQARGRRIAINLVGKFPPSADAELFLERSRVAIEAAGFRLSFSLMRPN